MENEMKLRMFVKEMPLEMKMISVGWGNGYVVIPPGHPFHGVEYDNVPVEIHGGLTYGELVDAETVEGGYWPELAAADIGGYVIGFDTAHYQDTPDNCDKAFVEAETAKLLDQCVKAA